MDKKEKLITRPPIITIAGHIDHGKTTLLNYIRQNKNPEKEYGGITQHINAYNINTKNGYMTFIDTPGHFAFNFLRINSINNCDIVLIIISIDDGIQTQTIESIELAQKFNKPIIIVINKIDKNYSENKKDKILNELLRYNLISDTSGGDTLFSFTSAKTGEGIDNLLDLIKLQSEMLNLKSNLIDDAEGIIFDNKRDNNQGIITSLILYKGTLKKGDVIKTNTSHGKIKLIMEHNNLIDLATPSMYVKVIGLSNNVKIGEKFIVVKEKISKKIQHDTLNAPITKTYDINEVLKKMLHTEEKKINFIIKADMQGSLNVLKDSLNELSKNNIKVNIVKLELGDITKSDIDLSIITKSEIIGFNIKINHQIDKLAKINKITVNIFHIIYDVIEYINKIIKKNISDNQEENITGIAEIKKIFNKDTKNIVAGCIVIQGKIKKNSTIKIYRKNNLIYTGIIDSLKFFQTSVPEVDFGNECGIIIKDYNNIQIGDKIKAYSIIQNIN